MKALFVCGKARKRSPTAAETAREWPGVESDYAGLSADADEPLSTEHIEWADIIFVMEKRQISRLTQKLGGAAKGARIVNLGIPDDFDFMDPTLVESLRSKLRRHLA